MLFLVMSYTISFYNSSVQKEIDRWPTGIYAKFLRIAEQIEQSGPNLGLPYTRALSDGLFEIQLARKRLKEIKK